MRSKILTLSICGLSAKKTLYSGFYGDESFLQNILLLSVYYCGFRFAPNMHNYFTFQQDQIALWNVSKKVLADSTVWDHIDLTVPIFRRISMLVKCDSDVTVFILNFSITNTFCLRRECSSLKPTVLLILALCDWCAVFFGTFARLADVWQFPYCICEQPHVLLQTGKNDIYFDFQFIW